MTFALLSARSAASIVTLLASLAFASLLWPASAQAATTRGSGTSASETRAVTADFQAIAVSGSIDLIVRQGSANVQVQADDNLLPLLERVVEAGSTGPTLYVRWKKGHSVQTRSPVTVRVATPGLTALAAAGSGEVELEPFNTPALKISMSGSGDLRLDRLTTEDLDIALSGSSDVAGAGRTARLKLGIAGSGSASLDGLQSDDVSVRIAGSGDASVHAQKSLAVSIMGSGDVRYVGNPALKTSVAGSGSVRKK